MGFLLFIGLGLLFTALFFGNSGKSVEQQTEELRTDLIKIAHGARTMSTVNDLAKASYRNGFYIGAPNWHWFGDGNILTCGEPGDGKGAAFIIPNFLSPRFLATGTTVFCLDPKGENYYVCHEQMRDYGYNVYRLNPMNMHSMGTNHINLFELRHFDSDDLATFCQGIAESLCPLTGERNATEYFNDKAQGLLVAYMIYLYEVFKEDMSFGVLYDHIMKEGKERIALLHKMKDCLSHEGIVSSESGSMLANIEMGGGENIAEIYSSAARGLKAFRDPQLKKITKKSDFDINELTEEKAALFINVPVKNLTAYSGWIRCLIGVVNAIKEEKANKQKRLLFMLDEFVQLGHVNEIERGIVTLRGYGVTYHLIVQQMEQLKAAYPHSSKSFFGSAVINALRVKDPEISKMLSDMTGPLVTVIPMGKDKNPLVAQRKVVTQDQFQNNNGHYLFLNGMPNVIKLPKVFYFRNEVFNGTWRKNPLH